MKDFNVWLSKHNEQDESEAEIVDLEIFESYTKEEMQQCWESAQKQVLKMNIISRILLSFKLRFGGIDAD